MLKFGDTAYPSLEGKVSKAEWRARVDLAALYRLIPLMGWYDLVMAPASARVPGEPNHYLFNPTGILFEEMTASALVKIDIEGKIVAETPFSIDGGAWYPMRSVHEVREDADWVIHTHDDDCAALSARREKLLPISQGAAFVLADGLAYHAYDGIETYAERMAGLRQSLGTANSMLLENHGAVTLGRSAWQALQRMSRLTKACRIQLLAGRDEDLVRIPEDVIATFPAELKRAGVNNPWAGLLRKLDRLDPSYRT